MAQSNPNYDTSNYDESDTSSSSSTPASDPDPYSMSTTRAIYAHSSSTVLPPAIDAASLPTGLPLLGPLTGFGSARRIRTINARLASIQGAIHRPLTVPEYQAVAWHTSKGLAIGSWGPTVGIAAGLARWWQTRDSMRWLFIGKLKDEGVNKSWREYYEAKAAAVGEEGAAQAKEAVKKPAGGIRWDNGRVWAGEREMLKAMDPIRKEAVVQGMRALPYVGFFWLVASLALSSYAATVTAVGELRDERLKSLEKDLRAQVRESVKRRRGDIVGGSSGAGQQRRDPTETPSEMGRTNRDGDDASPMGGEGGFFGAAEVEERARMMGNGEAKPQRQGGGFQRTPPNTFQTSDRQGGFQQDRYEKQPRSSESSFDDASPTGGMGSMSDDPSSSEGGSAWERIRQNSASGSPSEPSGTRGRRMQRRGGGFQQQQQRRREAEAEDDGFAISRSEEERNYAKDEAQREFDARVEKERAGGDFSGGRDGRW